LEDYGSAWADIMNRVRLGYSWSGHERNVAYLNEGGSGRFADVSAVSGFDFPDDGRAMALVDWDQDGDVDVWMRNRTAPRLRLLLNQCEARTAVSLKLVGVASNRDAIGASAELGGLRKSVRAGDLFLSQSSKWLHFGVAGDGAVQVRWPGGAVERFDGVEAGGRYVLKEGSGTVSIVEGRRGALVTGDVPAEKVSGAARIVMPARVPLPEIRYRDKVAKLQVLQPRKRLLVLWSAECAHCKRLFNEWSKGGPKVDVLALAVDSMESGGLGKVYSVMDQIDLEWGMIEQESLAGLAKLQDALFDGAPEISVPLVLLLDDRGKMVSMYRGSVAMEVLNADIGTLPGATPLELHHFAAPLKGTWFTNPVDPRWFESVVRGR
jgi:hypothetical protein